MTRTGRPRSFDEQHVVRGAKDVFWRRGYATASLRELATELGVLPGSLYGALGKKHDLFLRALRDYVDDTRAAATALASQQSPLGAVRMLLDSVLTSAVSEPGRGCMLGNTAMELLPNDEPVRKIVQSGLHALEAGIEQALREAQRVGEIRDDIDCAAQARLLVIIIQGLHVIARTESDPRRLGEVIDTMLDSITLSAEGA